VKKAARVLKADISPSFGLKAVEKRKSIVETAVASGSFNVCTMLILLLPQEYFPNIATQKTLVAAVTAAGLAETLSGGLITVLAPNDEAFAKLPPGTVDGAVPSPLYSTLLCSRSI
jgi:uncharacterized surface protein with fasciclin (FAS1) repeats